MATKVARDPLARCPKTRTARVKTSGRGSRHGVPAHRGRNDPIQMDGPAAKLASQRWLLEPQHGKCGPDAGAARARPKSRRHAHHSVERKLWARPDLRHYLRDPPLYKERLAFQAKPALHPPVDRNHCRPTPERAPRTRAPGAAAILDRFRRATPHGRRR